MTQAQFNRLKPGDLVESRAGTVVFLGVVNDKVLLCYQSGAPILDSYSVDVFIKEFELPREIYIQHTAKDPKGKSYYIGLDGGIRQTFNKDLTHAFKMCNCFRIQRHATHYKNILLSPQYHEYIRERMQEAIDSESDR
jgi:hypothetical protein